MTPSRHYGAAAGRQSARWRFFCVTIVVALTATGRGADDSSVSVIEADGVYRVSATFSVPQTPASAVGVLTDFERIPAYMPDIKLSAVREHGDSGTVVEQEAIAKFAMFSKRVHLILQVSQRADTITFRDTCGRSFAVYEGSWVVAKVGDGATITYRLAAKPNFEVPGFVLKRLLKRDASDLIERIKAEIAARGNLRK